MSSACVGLFTRCVLSSVLIMKRAGWAQQWFPRSARTQPMLRLYCEYLRRIYTTVRVGRITNKHNLVPPLSQDMNPFPTWPSWHLSARLRPCYDVFCLMLLQPAFHPPLWPSHPLVLENDMQRVGWHRCWWPTVAWSFLALMFTDIRHNFIHSIITMNLHSLIYV